MSGVLYFHLTAAFSTGSVYEMDLSLTDNQTKSSQPGKFNFFLL